MNVAFVDELVKDNNGVKYRLVRHHMFDRTVDAKGTKREEQKIPKRLYENFWL